MGKIMTLNPSNDGDGRLSRELSEKIIEIENTLAEMAEETGTSVRYDMTTIPEHLIRDKSKDNLPLAFLGALAAMAIVKEEIVLERRGGQWGIRYVRSPSQSQQQLEKAMDVPVHQAPLNVRQQFLDRFPDFFARFEATCAERAKPMSESIAKADAALALMKRFRAKKP